MVYFECDTCGETLKKKQVLIHYKSVCRQTHSFSCLSCHKHFDRESIVNHTTCISEEEKYCKGDKDAQFNKKKFVNNTLNLKDNSEEIDFSGIKWRGFRKTTKAILDLINIKKANLIKLVDVLSLAYSKNKKIDIDDVDKTLVKTMLIDKIQDDSKTFVFDLLKGTIKLK